MIRTSTWANRPKSWCCQKFHEKRRNDGTTENTERIYMLKNSVHSFIFTNLREVPIKVLQQKDRNKAVKENLKGTT